MVGGPQGQRLIPHLVALDLAPVTRRKLRFSPSPLDFDL